MSYSTLPIAGIDLNSIQTAAQIALQGEPANFGPLGTETFASDGKRYVWAVAATVKAVVLTLQAVVLGAIVAAATAQT